MSEHTRRLNNRERILAHLQQYRRVRNVDLIPIGGLRSMGRVWELQRDHIIDVTHDKGGVWIVSYHGPRVPGQQKINWELAS